LKSVSSNSTNSKSSARRKKVEDTFSQDWEIARILLSKDPNLATLYELETHYNTLAVYNFLELLDFKEEIEELMTIEADLKRQQAAQQQKANKNGRGKR